MRKKLVAFLCAFLFLLPLSACRNEEEEDTNKITIYKIEAIENKELTEPEETEPELTEPTEPTEPEVTETRPATEPVFRRPGAEDAMEYIHSLYQDDGKQTRSDFERYAYVRVGGVEFNVQWSVDVNKTLVEIVPGEDGTVTIDVNEECREDTPYVLTATITDADGNVATYSWNYILPKAQDADEIMKAAYALKDGESLPYESRLTGTVTQIETPYDINYDNISVVIQIEGYPQYSILCYRLKGTGVDQITEGDLITVTGIIMNYNGAIEFDTGCIMTDRVSKS